MKTAQQGSANWTASAPRAVADWQTGVQNYTGDWAGATTRQQAVMQANWDASVINGTWAAGVNRVGTAGWKSKTTSKAGNFTTGFAAGAAAQAAAMQKIMSALGNIVPNLPPRGTFQQNVTRSTTLMSDLHALRGTLGA